MSGNNNVTVAFPGHDNWAIWWQTTNLENFQLDIVGFLAVLGEGAVLANSQVSALSRLFFLPRLLPAPQALIRTTRPTKLPPTAGTVTAVWSGNVKKHVHHIADILLHTEPAMPAYTVRCVKVEINDNRRPSAPSFLDRTFRGQPSKTDDKTEGKTDEKAEVHKEDGLAPIVRARAAGPQTWVTLIGFIESLVLLIASITFGDGMSIMATVVLSLVSTIVGICNKWTLRLPKNATHPTEGDVVIRYENGSFLVVKCDEAVSRALYFAPEEIDYLIESPALYRILSLVATLFLMLGIVFLANAKIQLQCAWAGAYVIINIAHWLAAALPQKVHWDLSCFTVQEQGIGGGPSSETFTEALWKTILITQSVQWVGRGDAAPKTPAWDKWLAKAESFAIKQLEHWDYGDLEDPHWPGSEGEKRGVVWTGPKKAGWAFKEEWQNCQFEPATNLQPGDVAHDQSSIATYHE